MHQPVNVPVLRDPLLNFESVGEFLLTVGGNRSTRPEHSRQCTAGVVWEPNDGRLRTSLDWTRIWQHDAIYAPANFIFSDFENIVRSLPFRVTRDPVTNRIVAIDATTLNISDTEMQAADFSADYEFHGTPLGTFHLATFTSFEPVLASRLSSSEPWINESGMGSLGPARWRGTLSLIWGRGPWATGWAARVTSHYLVSDDESLRADEGGPHVPLQHFHDLWVRYEFEQPVGPFNHVQVVFGAKNVLGTRPALDTADPNLSSRYGWGELRQLSLTLRMSQH